MLCSGYKVYKIESAESKINYSNKLTSNNNQMATNLPPNVPLNAFAQFDAVAIEIAQTFDTLIAQLIARRDALLLELSQLREDYTTKETTRKAAIQELELTRQQLQLMSLKVNTNIPIHQQAAEVYQQGLEGLSTPTKLPCPLFDCPTLQTLRSVISGFGELSVWEDQIVPIYSTNDNPTLIELKGGEFQLDHSFTMKSMEDMHSSINVIRSVDSQTSITAAHKRKSSDNAEILDTNVSDTDMPSLLLGKEVTISETDSEGGKNYSQYTYGPEDGKSYNKPIRRDTEDESEKSVFTPVSQSVLDRHVADGLENNSVDSSVTSDLITNTSLSRVIPYTEIANTKKCSSLPDNNLTVEKSQSPHVAFSADEIENLTNAKTTSLPPILDEPNPDLIGRDFIFNSITGTIHSYNPNCNIPGMGTEFDQNNLSEISVNECLGPNHMYREFVAPNTVHSYGESENEFISFKSDNISISDTSISPLSLFEEGVTLDQQIDYDALLRDTVSPNQQQQQQQQQQHQQQRQQQQQHQQQQHANLDNISDFSMIMQNPLQIPESDITPTSSLQPVLISGNSVDYSVGHISNSPQTSNDTLAQYLATNDNDTIISETGTTTDPFMTTPSLSGMLESDSIAPSNDAIPLNEDSIVPQYVRNHSPKYTIGTKLGFVRECKLS